jgi:hypothetical protein
MTIRPSNIRQHITLNETIVERLARRGYAKPADISDFIKAAVIDRLDKIEGPAEKADSGNKKYDFFTFLKEKYDSSSPHPRPEIDVKTKIFKETKNGDKKEYERSLRTITLIDYHDNYFVIFFGVDPLEIPYSMVEHWYSNKKIILYLSKNIVLPSDGVPRGEPRLE